MIFLNKAAILAILFFSWMPTRCNCLLMIDGNEMSFKAYLPQMGWLKSILWIGYLDKHVIYFQWPQDGSLRCWDSNFLDAEIHFWAFGLIKSFRHTMFLQLMTKDQFLNYFLIIQKKQKKQKNSQVAHFQRIILRKDSYFFHSNASSITIVFIRISIKLGNVLKHYHKRFIQHSGEKAIK